MERLRRRRRGDVNPIEKQNEQVAAFGGLRCCVGDWGRWGLDAISCFWDRIGTSFIRLIMSRKATVPQSWGEGCDEDMKGRHSKLDS